MHPAVLIAIAVHASGHGQLYSRQWFRWLYTRWWYWTAILVGGSLLVQLIPKDFSFRKDPEE